MSKVKRKETLAEVLDRIDEEVATIACEGFYKSRLRILVGMWEKGKAIDTECRGVNSGSSYYAMMRETGRDEKSLKKWRTLYQKHPERSDYLPIAEKKALGWAQKALGSGDPHVAQNSGVSEWYTPREYIEAARLVMGGIDVDPATTKEVNRTIIKAKTFYTKDNSGLEQSWPGRVWLNPPYAQPLVTQFCNVFAEKYECGEIEQGCVLINNITETDIGQRLLMLCGAVCFPDARVKFVDQDGKPGAPLQGQMLLYFGRDALRFRRSFKEFGVCLNAGK